MPWEENAYDKWSPSKFTEGFSTPTVVITGERDYRVPYTQSLQFFNDLQLQKVPSRLVVFPEAGHWPSWYEMAFYYLVHIDWFHQWLGGGAPPWDVERFLRNQVFVEPSAEDGSLGPRGSAD
jgi:dipeptidyl aminopeptidase/acylaminoacyl peptidase